VPGHAGGGRPADREDGYQPVTRYERARATRARTIRGVKFIAQAGNVYELNETADVIWQLLVEPVTVEQIATRLAAEYDVAVSVVSADVESVLAELVELGFVTERASD
jgi:hypothetical protein